MEMQRQQMQQQQNMTILFMNAVGMSNCHQQQLEFGNNSTNNTLTGNQQQHNKGEDEMSKE
jgi:hypothetical protein